MKGMNDLENCASISKITNQIIANLWRNGNTDASSIATLRQAKSIDDPEVTDIYPILFRFIPKDELSKTGKPTVVETSVFAAVQLWALYQQGKNQYLNALNDHDSANKNDLFVVLGRLRNNDSVAQGLDRRVQQVLQTRDLNRVTDVILHLLDILKANKSQAINFSRLAFDFYQFQVKYLTGFGYRRVILRWGQEYYAYLNDNGQSIERK